MNPFLTLQSHHSHWENVLKKKEKNFLGFLTDFLVLFYALDHFQDNSEDGSMMLIHVR